MIPPSPALLIAAACARLGGRALTPRRAGHGQTASMVGTRSEDEAQVSMRFINAVGYWAHFDPCTGESGWPLPHLESVHALAEYGRERRVLFERPSVGDLALWWSPLVRRFARATIVTAFGEPDVQDGLEGIRCLTLGAHNVNPKARAERVIPALGDRFLRWQRLVGRDSHSGRAA